MDIAIHSSNPNIIVVMRSECLEGKAEKRIGGEGRKDNERERSGGKESVRGMRRTRAQELQYPLAVKCIMACDKFVYLFLHTQ